MREKLYSIILFMNLEICRDLKVYLFYHFWLQKSNLIELLYKMKNFSFHQSQLYFSFVAGECKAFARYKAPTDRQFLGTLTLILRCEVSTNSTRHRGSISEFKAYYVLFQEKTYAEGCTAKKEELPPNIRSSQTVGSCKKYVSSQQQS